MMSTAVTPIASLLRRLAWPVEPGAFRLWLAGLVVVHHLSSFGLGKAAVYIFFALSGYWLPVMWDRRYRNTHSPYLTYLLSRFWRLAPVMIVASFVAIVMELVLGKPASAVFAEPAWLAISSTFFIGYGWLGDAPLGPAWSLDVEWQFYMILPLVAGAFARRPVAGFAIAIVISLAAASLLTVPTLLQYAAFFAAGMFAARFQWQPSSRLWKGSALAFAALLVLFTLGPWRGVLWGGAHPGPLFAWNPAFNVAMAVIALPFALRTVSLPSDSLDRALGDLSYPAYLLHWGGALWFYTLVAPTPVRAGAALLVIALVAIASLAAWYWIDRPSNRARARWVAGRERGAQMDPDIADEIAAP